jgi:DNA-binding PadR family transcriptional regulator
MIRSPSSTLRFVLLGLIAQSPCSGYDIRKMFSISPLKMYCPSPASVYPALYRLREEGLIESAETAPATGRRKAIFRLTSAGLDIVQTWLAEPVVRDDVERNLAELQMKFALTGEIVGEAQAAKFLAELEREVSSYLRWLEDYADAVKDSMSITGLLSLECGIDGFRAQAQWARRALAILAERTKIA